MLRVAAVEEAACIGCTACFQACPTGAIVGAAKQIHAVISALCTGCNACVPVCPVPCIAMVPWPGATHPLQGPNAEKAIPLVAAHAARLENTTKREQALGKPSLPMATLALPAELTALAQAARERSLAKYKKKGPIRRPRALKKSP